jgi:hypothetical protein
LIKQQWVFFGTEDTDDVAGSVEGLSSNFATTPTTNLPFVSLARTPQSDYFPRISFRSQNYFQGKKKLKIYMNMEHTI